MNKFIVSILFAAALLGSCKSGETSKKVVAPLKSETDSLAYVIGMNIATNVIKMDSTINVAALCRAIADVVDGKSILSQQEAKTYYLRYLTHVVPERKRGYEEQFLADLAKSSRDYTRTKSGITYNIAVIGDEQFTPKGVNDVISLRYTLSRVNNEQIFSSYDQGDTLVVKLRELPQGVQESVKMIGKGGKINAWIPSKEAYGQYGDSLLGIEPFETLYYQMEMVDVELTRRGTVIK